MVSATEVHGSPHQHVVSFYGLDEELVGHVGSFVAEGLHAGEPAIVVVTARNGVAIEADLRRRGIDVAAARRDRLLVTIDADDALESILEEASTELARFCAVASELVAALGADGPAVRVTGELVALLWDAMGPAAALELETYWEHVAARQPLSLLCAYPISSLAASDDLDAVEQVCAHHSELLAPDRYPAPSGVGAVGPLRCSHLFVPAPAAVRAVRRFVTDTLGSWLVDPAVTQDAALLSSELATNSLLHASSPFRVALSRSGSAVRVTVDDTSIAVPVPGAPAADQAHGRGLALVQQIAARWGSEIRPDGKAVWAELDLAAG